MDKIKLIPNDSRYQFIIDKINETAIKTNQLIDLFEEVTPTTSQKKIIVHKLYNLHYTYCGCVIDRDGNSKISTTSKDRFVTCKRCIKSIL